jgi:CheY-like chemotaxis protein
VVRVPLEPRTGVRWAERDLASKGWRNTFYGGLSRHTDTPPARVAVGVTVDNVKVVAATGSGEDAVALAIRHRPDVVLMDLNLPGTSGLEATRRIVEAAPGVAVLILTMVDDDDACWPPCGSEREATS